MWRPTTIFTATLLSLLACGEGAGLPNGVLSTRVWGDDPAWRQPALDEHRAYVVADPRYRAFGARNLEQFEAHFWGVGHSASGAGTILEFSGMWNLPNQGKDFSQDAYERCFGEFDSDMAARDQYLPLWLFEHEVVLAREDGERIEVEVRPREAGVQIIALHLREQIYGCQGNIVFVDGKGGVIGVFEGIWSTPP